jgi:hypothetical protein
MVEPVNKVLNGTVCCMKTSHWGGAELPDTPRILSPVIIQFCEEVIRQDRSQSGSESVKSYMSHHFSYAAHSSAHDACPRESVKWHFVSFPRQEVEGNLFMSCTVIWVEMWTLRAAPETTWQVASPALRLKMKSEADPGMDKAMEVVYRNIQRIWKYVL